MAFDDSSIGFLKRFLQLCSVVGLLCGGFAVKAQSRCSQEWACVDEVHSDNGEVNLYLRNNKAYAITMTVVVTTDNLVSAQGNSFTKTLRGGQKVWVSRFQKANKHRTSALDFDIQWAVGSMDVKHDDAYLYRLPYARSDDKGDDKDDGHYVVQGFNGGYSHRGLAKYAVDFAMANGTKLYAAREGTVVDVESSHNRGGASRRYAGYANFVVIEHSDGSTGEYYHLQQHGVFVGVGDKVKRGQLIGLSGSTGFTSLPHLHFAVYKAMPDGDTQSLRFKFVAASGVVDQPRYGQRYRVNAE
jgi:murein DD-endopeptidase MepM/ murein hydrolase activator NlpD